MPTPTSSNGINAHRVSVTDDFNNLKPNSSQEADALKNVQDRVFAQAESVARRQGVAHDIAPGATSGGAFGPSAPGFGADGKDGITGNMTSNTGAGVRPVTVRKVDFKDLHTGADYRTPDKDTSNDSLKQAADNGGPRSAMRGQQNSKHFDESKPNFKSFPGNLTDSDSGN